MTTFCNIFALISSEDLSQNLFDNLALSALLPYLTQLLAFSWLISSSPKPDTEAEQEDDDGGGEDGVGDAADAGQDLDTEQVEPASV